MQDIDNRFLYAAKKIKAWIRASKTQNCTIEEAALGAFGVTKLSDKEQKTVAKGLKILHWRRKRVSRNKVQVWVYVAPDGLVNSDNRILRDYIPVPNSEIEELTARQD